MSQKVINGILIGLLIVAILLGSLALAKANKPMVPPTPQNPNPPPQGLGNAFGQILSNLFNSDFWKNLFGKKDEYPVVDCDPNRKGYEKDGTPNPNCGKDYTGCTVGKCDPKRPGFDECGFLDVNCGG